MAHEIPSLLRGHRALAAIVVTDGVGFSARMSVDEELTLNLIHRDLRLMADLCEKSEGHVLKSTGDGLLMYFVSAIQAVTCALEIQKALAQMAADMPPNESLEHRIGIHLGDIFFSESDVMGNGVNIAARLQNEAEPSGICISQVVYDVVKARINLNAKFVGPLALKNIQETVPAYKIPPPNRVNDTGCGDSTSGTTQVSLNEAQALLVEIAETFERHPNSLRIKKLLFGTCQNRWENDRTILGRVSFGELLQTVFKQFPRLSQLKIHLMRTVATLNRKETYSAIAELILEHTEPLYTKLNETTSLPSDSESDRSSSDYFQIAQALEQHPNALRIKKLLYSVCHHTWENNRSILQSVAMDILVAQTHQATLSLPALNHRLSQIVCHLNRQAEYTLVANVISHHFQALYSSDHDSTQLRPTTSDNTEMFTGTATQFKDSSGLLTSEFTAVTPTMVSPTSNLNSTQAVSSQPTSTASPSPRRIKDRSDLFELRLEIIRYTNPLRAKLLIFSSLYSPFSFSQQDWITLKSKTLDDLLKELFNYGQTFTDVANKLEIIAHCLDDSDENIQAVNTILKAIRAYYPDDILRPVPIPSSSKPATLNSEAPQASPPASFQDQTAIASEYPESASIYGS